MVRTRSSCTMNAVGMAIAFIAIASAPAPVTAQRDSAVANRNASSAMPLVIGETFSLISRTLGETRRINVYVPPSDSVARLPVMYMPDGGMGEDFLHIAGLLQVSIGNGTMRPFILVGIENTERRRDMTGPTQNAEDRRIAVRVGGSAAFRKFIADELMPFVNARYRTTDETAIMGESLAGLFVVETYVVAPEMFDTYIAFDPSLWWNDSSLVSRARTVSPERAKATARVYLASSDEPDLARLTSQLADALATDPPAGLAVVYQPMPRETHGTIYHPAALQAIRRLFKPEAPRP